MFTFWCIDGWFVFCQCSTSPVKICRFWRYSRFKHTWLVIEYRNSSKTFVSNGNTRKRCRISTAIDATFDYTILKFRSSCTGHLSNATSTKEVFLNDTFLQFRLHIVALCQRERCILNIETCSNYTCWPYKEFIAKISSYTWTFVSIIWFVRCVLTSKILASVIDIVIL